jgi:hypothetical protein
LKKHYSIQAADDYLESEEGKRLISAMPRSDSYHSNIAWRIFMAGWSARDKAGPEPELILPYRGKVYKK